jgi:two-component system response regulator (stage 0 sporulation protein F)
MDCNKENSSDNVSSRILVIDDSPIMRNLLFEILSDDGYQVDTAENGELGLNQAIDQDYDLIITDVHMPLKNGLEVVQELLIIKPHSKIVLTDSFPDKLAARATEEGALCCLQKPFDLKELRKIIFQICSGEKISIE